jgi:ADP-ribosylglycohydrolase
MIPAPLRLRIDRAKGAMAGLALGDVVGAQVDGWSASAIRSRLRAVTGPDSRHERDYLLRRVDMGENPRKVAKSAGMFHPPWLYYHMGQQAMTVAQCLLKDRDAGGAAFARACAELARPSRRGKFGLHRTSTPGFRASICRILSGEDWRASGEDASHASAGARAIPLGIAHHENPEALARVTAEMVLVTDRTASAVMPAVGLALFVVQASRAEPPRSPHNALEALLEALEAAEEPVREAAGSVLLSEEEEIPLFRRVLASLKPWVLLGPSEEEDRYALHVLQKELRRILPEGKGRLASGFAPAVSGAAIYFTVTENRSPANAILRAVNLGGPASVLGALTGGICGAAWGLSALPREWVDGLWNRTAFLTLGEALVRPEAGERWVEGLHALESDTNRRYSEVREALRCEILERAT